MIYDNTGTSQTYMGLDATGNVTAQMSSWASSQSSYSGQRLVSQTSTSGVTTKFLYDGLGNLVCKTSDSWSSGACPATGDASLLELNSYDYKSRLTAYAKYNGSGALTDSASYVLDALDRTISETETHSGETSITSTTYVGDTSAVYKEALSGAQQETKTYSYDASGNALTLIDNSVRYSYLYDPGSSVSLLIDGSGATKESYGYSAYGNANVAISKKASGFSTGKVPTNPVRFQGKRFDSGSGGYDMGARRYSPSVGRWLQQDMYYGALDNLGLSQDPMTANRYAFLGANPVNYVELDGHKYNPIKWLGGQLARRAWRASGSSSDDKAVNITAKATKKVIKKSIKETKDLTGIGDFKQTVRDVKKGNWVGAVGHAAIGTVKAVSLAAAFVTGGQSETALNLSMRFASSSEKLGVAMRTAKARLIIGRAGSGMAKADRLIGGTSSTNILGDKTWLIRGAGALRENGVTFGKVIDKIKKAGYRLKYRDPHI